jgi:hypothetical protein
MAAQFVFFYSVSLALIARYPDDAATLVGVYTLWVIRNVIQSRRHWWHRR